MQPRAHRSPLRRHSSRRALRYLVPSHGVLPRRQFAERSARWDLRRRSRLPRPRAAGACAYATRAPLFASHAAPLRWCFHLQLHLQLHLLLQLQLQLQWHLELCRRLTVQTPPSPSPPFTPLDCLSAQIASAIAWLHARGVIHRDVKPSNIVIDEGGLAKLCDFGLARRPSASMTIGGGTPMFMPPEQLVSGDGGTSWAPRVPRTPNTRRRGLV